MCPYRNCCKLLSIRRWHRLQDIINIKRRWTRSWRLSLTPSSSFRSASTCCTLGGDTADTHVPRHHQYAKPTLADITIEGKAVQRKIFTKHVSQNFHRAANFFLPGGQIFPKQTDNISTLSGWKWKRWSLATLCFAGSDIERHFYRFCLIMMAIRILRIMMMTLGTSLAETLGGRPYWFCLNIHLQAAASRLTLVLTHTVEPEIWGGLEGLSFAAFRIYHTFHWLTFKVWKYILYHVHCLFIERVHKWF